LADIKVRSTDVNQELHKLALTRLGSLDNQRFIDEVTRTAAVDSRNNAADRFRHLVSGKLLD
jgi:hypothetical protein